MEVKRNMEFGERIEKTILIGVCWTVLSLLILSFNPVNLGFWQNIGTILLTGVMAGGFIALNWVDVCTISE
jgi:hypothetical protein